LRPLAPAGPPGYPETGDEVSKPLSCAEVYICGGMFVDWVSGRLVYPFEMGREEREPACSLCRA
jgi:hypothetical protein